MWLVRRVRVALQGQLQRGRAADDLLLEKMGDQPGRTGRPAGEVLDEEGRADGPAAEERGRLGVDGETGERTEAAAFGLEDDLHALVGFGGGETGAEELSRRPAGLFRHLVRDHQLVLLEQSAAGVETPQHGGGELRIAQQGAPHARIREHARSRGWTRLRLVSTAGTTYNRDYHGETEDGSQIPSLNVFVRRGGKIHHFYNSELLFAPTPEGQDPRHVDPIWPLWNLFDFTPEGRGKDWYPKLSYGAERSPAA